MTCIRKKEGECIHKFHLEDKKGVERSLVME